MKKPAYLNPNKWDVLSKLHSGRGHQGFHGYIDHTAVRFIKGGKFLFLEVQHVLQVEVYGDFETVETDQKVLCTLYEKLVHQFTMNEQEDKIHHQNMIKAAIKDIS